MYYDIYGNIKTISGSINNKKRILMCTNYLLLKTSLEELEIKYEMYRMEGTKEKLFIFEAPEGVYNTLIRASGGAANIKEFSYIQ